MRCDQRSICYVPNVDVVVVQLLAIGHRNRNALLLLMRIG